MTKNKLVLGIPLVLSCTLLSAIAVLPQSPGGTTKPTVRARDLGVPFDGVSGLYNAITDVPGVAVGYKTLIAGEGPTAVGQGPVRTGVTAILPRGQKDGNGVFAGFFAGNGNGDMTGTHWIEEAVFSKLPSSLPTP